MTWPIWWIPTTKYRVPGGWRHVATCTRCGGICGFDHPDSIRDAIPHDRHTCDDVLRVTMVNDIMTE